MLPGRGGEYVVADPHDVCSGLLRVMHFGRPRGAVKAVSYFTPNDKRLALFQRLG